ncbi:MAG: trypsin-like peptidase domain-containing protein [Actinomycetota bacterium]|nr:trypsin-like peptidase domain-containing protein [Actinomycetota bacterium]
MSAYEPPPHHVDAPQQPPPTPPEPPRRRGVGLVLVAVLLAGLLGGVVGAVGYATLADDDSEPSGASTSTSTSTSDTLAQDTTSSDTAPERSVQEVAAEVLPSVVKIDVITAEGVGSGSGVILSSDGEILTNNHVVELATDEGLIVAFDDGTSAPATVVGTDPLLDLAVIRAEGVSDLPTATLGSSDDLSVGQEVVAVGSPFGLESTVTSGIVSALDRPITAGSTPDGSTVFPAIQTDAAINPGNSGGALVDTEGQVVGINTAIRTDSSSTAQGGSIGLGFAIPIDEARPIADQLSQGETPTHARIGVTVSDALDENGVLGGARIEEVGSDGAAAAAGLQTDDVVVRVDENLVGSSNDLVATIRGYRPGDEVTLTIVRDGEVEEAEVTLESDEGSPTS